jgi:hypothetical protein
MNCSACASRVWRCTAIGYLIVLRVDVGAHGKELVDEAEMTFLRRKMQSGLALLRWRGRGAAAMERGGAAQSVKGCMWWRRLHSHADR